MKYIGDHRRVTGLILLMIILMTISSGVASGLQTGLIADGMQNIPLVNGIISPPQQRYSPAEQVQEMSFVSEPVTDIVPSASEEHGLATETYQFVRKWGLPGTGSGYLDEPSGLALNANNYVYVADRGNSRIQVFTSTGTYVNKWGTNGTHNREFYQPCGIALNNVGQVFVADTFNHRIQKFSSTGSYITQWGTEGNDTSMFDDPHGVAVDPIGNVYVSDTFNNRIQKFTSNGVFMKQWGSYGSLQSQFNGPRGGAAIDNSGNVYVPDFGNNRIQKFTSNGVFIRKWGSLGNGTLQFNMPRAVATDSDGNVYVVDTGNDRVQKFTSNGVFVTEWGSFGTGNGQFSYPSGIAVDSAGRVYVADTNNNRIQVFEKVTPANPTISRIFPTSGFNSGNLVVIVTGTNFRTGARVQLKHGSTTKTGTVSFLTGTTITCSIPLAGAPVGLYNVVVTNTDGTSGIKPNAFTVRQAGARPTISSVNPTWGLSNKNTVVTITGNNFRTGVIVQMTRGTTVKRATITSRSLTKIICVFPTNGALAGLWNVKITNTDGTTVTRSGAFLVRYAGPNPTISSISPNSGLNTQNTVVHIYGSNFRTGVIIQMIRGTTVKRVTVYSRTATHLLCNFPTHDAATGLWNVKITNTDTTSVTRTGGFRVHLPTDGGIGQTSQVTSTVIRSPVMGYASPVQAGGSILSGGGVVPVVGVIY